MIFWILLAFVSIVSCLAVVHVRTGSRLHFGLLSLSSAGNEPDPAAGVGPRHFGGVGMMVSAPGIRLSAETASSWSAEGPLSERALGFATRMAQALPETTIPPQRLTIEACAPEHV